MSQKRRKPKGKPRGRPFTGRGDPRNWAVVRAARAAEPYPPPAGGVPSALYVMRKIFGTWKASDRTPQEKFYRRLFEKHPREFYQRMLRLERAAGREDARRREA